MNKALATKLVRGPRGGVGIHRVMPAAPGRRVGATNPNFAVPSGFDQSTAGQALLTAANNLLTAYSNGVPSEHAYDANAAAFQTAWNADPTIAAAGGNALLDVDGGYGPNTNAAVAAVNGGSAPTVNTNPAPPGAPPAVVTPTTPVSPASVLTAGMPVWGLWLVGAAVVGGAYLVGKSAMEKHGPMAAHHAGAHARTLRRHAKRLSRRPSRRRR